MNKLLRRIWHDRSAATAIEYGLIISFVIIAMMGALTTFADVSTGMWNDISEQVQAT